MKRSILALVLFLPLAQLPGQDQANAFSLSAGAHYNQSSTEFNTTTGIGIFVEPNLLINGQFRLGYRFEPTALAEGVLVLPGGCTEEHPVFPGVPSCREGANYVLNNYLKAEYLLGKPKFGRKGGRYQLYAGAHFSVLTHKRYIITSRVPGNWTDTHQWVTNPGYGLRAGALLGRFDLSVSYNRTGRDFRDHLGLGISYQVWQREKSN